ncbi:beta-ketoacyl-[acyl-carrier-protein] synthase family protein [Paralimibaculum aggregatum]|uniref:Beta-ketoacyl-[acyl-carrier-protein] synthase family protein n=2 Tax=Paralimibaculum aggregatum TaxID=3036245 RepID=A0ABQ6LSF4_9RHOB|nr:beta-ketoacyl-[acyl-carrier-protein] synthase family protein [Limibaculum sp. NKW23]
MRSGRSGLAPCDWGGLPIACHIGRVAGIEADPFPGDLAAWDNRATRLALAALEADGITGRIAAARSRWGAARCAVVIGTSTSGVETLERAYRARADGAPLAAGYSLRHHNDHQAVAAFLQRLCGLDGPAYTISTACSSSAKALVDAVQLIEAGLADAVLCGGVDSLCRTSLAGFDALELVSRAPCRPCDAARDGLSIGEGAAFLLVEREGSGPRLAGFGESTDGTSMSTPPEDGAGAHAAMAAALQRAGIAPAAVGYVNLHGTATPANDSAECAAVARLFGAQVPVSSLKGLVGHTLGAAGAVEAVMALIAMEAGLLPGNAGLATPDPEIACAVLAESREAPLSHLLSNAFGFGGNNCALVLAR